MKGKDTSVAMLQDTHLSSNAATQLRCLWVSANVSPLALPLGPRRNTRTHTDMLGKLAGGLHAQPVLRSVEGLLSVDKSVSRGYHTGISRLQAAGTAVGVHPFGTGSLGKAVPPHTGELCG